MNQYNIQLRDYLKAIVGQRYLVTHLFPNILTVSSGIVINGITSDSFSITLWGAVIWMLLVLTGYLMSTMIHFYLYRDRSRINMFKNLAISNLQGQIDVVRKFKSDDSYFKTLLAALRTKSEMRKFKSIQRTHRDFWVVNSLDMWDYFIYMFRSLMEELLEGDEYLTVSVVDFWSKDRSQIELARVQGVLTRLQARSLFETNLDKCRDGGVISKRVVVVNRSILVRAAQNKILDIDEQEYLLKLDNILDKFASADEDDNERFRNYFYLIEEEGYERIRSEDIPFAIVRRKDYADKLCVSTYIPKFYKSLDSNKYREDWKIGEIPKIGFLVAEDDSNIHYSNLYKKFENLFGHDPDRGGPLYSAKGLRDKMEKKNL